MRRLVRVGLVILLNLAPLLAQATAAEALAHSVAELADRHVIDPAEPPVDGDGLTPPSLQPAPSAASQLHPFCRSVATLDSLACRDATSPVAADVTTHSPPSHPPAGWPPPNPAQRQAALQVFLF